MDKIKLKRIWESSVMNENLHPNVKFREVPDDHPDVEEHSYQPYDKAWAVHHRGKHVGYLYRDRDDARKGVADWGYQKLGNHGGVPDAEHKQRPGYGDEKWAKHNMSHQIAHLHEPT